MGSLKRVIQCICLDDTDTMAYCGTKTGDLLEVNISNFRFARASKQRFGLGVQCVAFFRGAKDCHVIVGNGDGSVARLDVEKLAVRKACQLLGSVTSVSMSNDGSRLYAGTNKGNVYSIEVVEMEAELRSTAHSTQINDVAFPSACSDLFVTCGGPDIRLWNTRTRMELLRIQVPNLECNCVAVMPNGKSIISGWDDGKIRAFFPESGKLQYVITDAHAESVTAVACTHDSSKVISGGKDGRVRVWNVSGSTQTMELSFKEHKRTF